MTSSVGLERWPVTRWVRSQIHHRQRLPRQPRNRRTCVGQDSTHAEMLDALSSIDGAFQPVWHIAQAIPALAVGAHVNRADGCWWGGRRRWCVKATVCLQIFDRQIVGLHLFQDPSDRGFATRLRRVTCLHLVRRFWLLSAGCLTEIEADRETDAGRAGRQRKTHKNTSSWAADSCCECGGLLRYLAAGESGRARSHRYGDHPRFMPAAASRIAPAPKNCAGCSRCPNATMSTTMATIG